MTDVMRPLNPVIWSIAGNDSGGGAGLSADARAAAAFGVHLCPVVAAITVQNSVAVTQVEPVSPELLDAQLAALAADMPPAAIKTGLLGGAAQIAVVARWVDRLRQANPQLALVVDPVLRSSTGAAFADNDTLRAYRELLLPRATLVTPNRREALRLTGLPDGTPVPALAAALQAPNAQVAGAQAVVITGGDDGAAQPAWSLDWVQTDLANGWLALPRLPTPHTHGTGCTFATSAAAALALGFVAPDALVLAKMATTWALRHGYAAGQGAGPVAAPMGFGTQPGLMPLMSWGEDSDFDSCLRRLDGRQQLNSWPEVDLGLYGIVDSAQRVASALEAGITTVQLRIKTPADHAADAAWALRLDTELRAALAACRAAGATLVVNDHWQRARDMAAQDPGAAPHLALHLGQEDLQALGADGRAALAATGLQLGISSHSLWELARARSLHPWYAACGPVWPTLTKDMPWRPQGLDNLAWWVHMAGAPVVAIGGILEHAQAEAAAASGAAGVCVVRGLGEDPAVLAPGWRAAIARGRAAARLPVPALPHPSLARN
ncbi:phosphomethylpyrimidine kinase [Ottowia oryzae]|uniref:hydroxymethylpyrimidine kinase n=2 Tax=Ottowia oryzae TaxID=2109914 RepID=A0A2S0MGD0_9BURK|nr:phosphomethylpyrimidine kinase [Ottowia oryzae]